MYYFFQGCCFIPPSQPLEKKSLVSTSTNFKIITIFQCLLNNLMRNLIIKLCLLLLHVLSIFHNGRRDLSKLKTTGSVPLLSQFYVQVNLDSDCFDPVSYVNLTIIVLTVLSADQKSRCKYRIKKNQRAIWSGKAIWEVRLTG